MARDKKSENATNAASTTNSQKNVESEKTKRTRLSQSAYPLFALDEAISISKAIKDNFAGQPTAPLLVASSCRISPTSSNWRTLTGASAAYGLTTGSYNAKEISLTPLGERVVAPLKEGDDIIALKEAALTPSILSEFYQQYNRNKLPKTDIAHNVLLKMGIPKDRLEITWQILKANATKTNMLKIISGNEYLFLDNVNSLDGKTSSLIAPQVDTPILPEDESADTIPSDVLGRMNISPPNSEPTVTVVVPKTKPNIFISHGKNNTVIVGQLKELLLYGQMEPIVSVERETTAIPVPDKVFDDMRNCDAGIINIDLEEITLEGGIKYNKLNENVLIEIGAAIALYGKRVILLCKKGTNLPSNLQGLYRCEYDGSQLDYAATMKLLKTMQELRTMM